MAVDIDRSLKDLERALKKLPNEIAQGLKTFEKSIKDLTVAVERLNLIQVDIEKRRLAENSADKMETASQKRRQAENSVEDNKEKTDGT